MEYLVTMTTHVPEGTPARAVEETEALEAERAKELAGQGYLRRLWALLWLPSQLRKAWEQRYPVLAEIIRVTATA